jgi:hypothetical protein
VLFDGMNIKDGVGWRFVTEGIFHGP